MDKERGREFREWLQKKMKWTSEEFAIKGGFHYSTVCKWAMGHEPREAHKLLIRMRFPDCPLAKK